MNEEKEVISHCNDNSRVAGSEQKDVLNKEDSSIDLKKNSLNKAERAKKNKKAIELLMAEHFEQTKDHRDVVFCQDVMTLAKENKIRTNYKGLYIVMSELGFGRRVIEGAPRFSYIKRIYKE